MAPDRILCPLCGKSLKVIKQPKTGARVRCPKCNGEFLFAAPQPSQILAPSAVQAAPPPVLTPPAVPVAPPRAAVRETTAIGADSKRRRSERPLAIFATVGFLVIAIAAGVYFSGVLSRADSHGTADTVARGNTPIELLSNLPKELYPEPGPDGQTPRDEANAWLRDHVAGKPVDIEFLVDEVEVLDKGDDTYDVNLVVTIDPALDDPVSLGGGVWGGDFEFNGVPCYLELWGEDPLLTGLSKAEAEQWRALKGQKVRFDCTTNDFEFQEGDDESQLKIGCDLRQSRSTVESVDSAGRSC